MRVITGQNKIHHITHKKKSDLLFTTCYFEFQSSQLAKPLWTDPGLNSEVSVHVLIPTLTTTKKSTGEE